MRTKEEKSHTQLRVEMEAAFGNNEILTVPEETLQKYLSVLCTEPVPNELVRHREIIRALTINHLQIQRYINKLNTRNTILTCLIIFLTVLTSVATGFGVYIHTKPTAPIREEILNIPSPSLETRGSISKTSKEDFSHINPKAIHKNTRKQERSLSIGSLKQEKSLSIDSFPKTNQPPIKDETKQKHK